MKQSTTLMLTLLILTLPITAQAACSPYPNFSNGVSFPTTVSVPSSLPVGGLITSAVFNGPFPIFQMNCPTPTLRTIIGRYGGAGGGALPNMPYLYKTNVPGIGMQIQVTLPSGQIGNATLASMDWTMHPGNFPYGYRSLQLQFYKIGPVTTGTVPSGNLHDHRWDSIQGRHQMLLNNSIRFVNPTATCDLATGDVNRSITLDTVKVSAFENASSAGARDFELTANCTNASNVTFRFSGTPAVADTWRFANTGTAGGISLWLYSRIGGTNQTIRANGTDSARSVTVSSNRAVLPLGAAYFKTGTVSQGTLASTATVNITYN